MLHCSLQAQLSACLRPLPCQEESLEYPDLTQETLTNSKEMQGDTSSTVPKKAIMMAQAGRCGSAQVQSVPTGTALHHSSACALGRHALAAVQRRRRGAAPQHAANVVGAAVLERQAQSDTDVFTRQVKLMLSACPAKHKSSGFSV